MPRAVPALFALLIPVAVVAATPGADAPGPPDGADLAAVREKVLAKLDELRQQATFPGASAGVVLADGRSFGVATGLADVEAKTPLKPTDRLLAGSVGKTFVAAVLLQLFEEGKVGLDDPLAKWLGKEQWFARLPNGPEITLRRLMNHTSGLPEYFEAKAFTKAITADPDKVWKPAELVAYVLDAKPLFAAGQGWAYADTNYILAGMVAEKASGKPLFEEVRRRLLVPLKLERTIPSDRRVIPDLVPGYAGLRGNPLGYEGRSIVDGKFVMNPQMEWAGGGFASTPEDLARWAKALYEGKVFQKPVTLTAMLAGVDAGGGRGGGKGNRYGLGVQMRESPWGPSYGHGGWFPGYRTEVEYFPKYKVAVAVQFNTDIGQSLKKGLRGYVGDVARVVLPAKE